MKNSKLYRLVAHKCKRYYCAIYVHRAKQIIQVRDTNIRDVYTTVIHECEAKQIIQAGICTTVQYTLAK